MERTNAWLASLAAAAACLASARAAKVQSWHHRRPADFDRAARAGVVVSDDGEVRLSRRLRPLAGLDATHVWAVAGGRAGPLFAATGDEGKVFLLDGGKASEVYAADDSQVLSLAADARGDAVFAGTGPAARVVRIDARGGKVVCSLPESYVWALALEPRSGAVYAATGPNGRVYRVTPDGKAAVFYETKQAHVLCLAVGPDGTVYAGTDRTGRVYRIDPRGKGFVLYQAPQSEVRTLTLTPDALFVGTCNAGRRPGAVAAGADSTSTAAADFRGPRPPRVKAFTASAKGAPAADAQAKDREKETGPAAPADAPAEPSAGENSVFRIALGARAGVREVFRARALVLSLHAHGSRLLVGTGMKGQLFEVDLAGRARTELARLDHGQILGLCRRGDGSVVVATGDPGRLYALDDRHVAEGTLTSDVLDARLVSRWGAARWRADVPAGAAASVRFRSGNVAEPDDTWSDWGAAHTDPTAATVDAPAARYLQYRLTLTSTGVESPAVGSLTVRYATTNQAPEVTKVEVPDLVAAAGKPSKKIEFRWKASDANQDELRYRLLVRKDGWDDWVRIEDDLDRPEYEWDTTTTPEGVYRLKVVASDHVDNPDPEALTAERTSEPFVVCHTAPAVKVAAAGLKDGRMALEARASSPLVRLTAASYSLNGKKWVNVFPADGLFDGKSERFLFRTAALPPGAYTVVLRVTDAAGNTGTGDVVFRVAK